jgi:tetratricopeptide (TPR) repeat protein
MNLFAIVVFLFVALQQSSQSPEFHFKKGIESSQAGNYELAIKDFTKAISLKPKYPEALYNRGIVYFEMKQPKKGFEDFDKAISLKPDNGIFWFQRGNRKWLALDNEGACNDWKKAKELNIPFAEETLKTKCSHLFPDK